MKLRCGLMCLAVLAAPLLAQKVHSKKEQEALQKIQADAQANNFDQEIADINSVLENFADTEFKNILLNWAVQAAQSKGDYAQTITFGEQAVEADANNIPARTALAETIAARTRDNDFDKEQKLKQADDYANKALELLKNATAPPPGIPAANWPEYKKQLTSDAYDALGQAAALRKKYPDAIQDMKSALENYPDNPITTARLAKIYVQAAQYDDAIATADKVLAMNNASSVVKTFAQQQKDQATKLKSSAK